MAYRFFGRAYHAIEKVGQADIVVKVCVFARRNAAQQQGTTGIIGG